MDRVSVFLFWERNRETELPDDSVDHLYSTSQEMAEQSRSTFRKTYVKVTIPSTAILPDCLIHTWLSMHVFSVGRGK